MDALDVLADVAENTMKRIKGDDSKEEDNSDNDEQNGSAKRPRVEPAAASTPVAIASPSRLKIYLMAKNAILGGWLKVAITHFKIVESHLRTIGVIVGMNEQDLSMIKLSSKVAEGTNNRRGDYKMLQQTRDLYLERSNYLLKNLLHAIDMYPDWGFQKDYSVLNRYLHCIEATRLLYDNMSWENGCYGSTNPTVVISSSDSPEDQPPQQQISAPTIDNSNTQGFAEYVYKVNRNNKCRAFRDKYLQHDFKAAFGFDISRTVKGGNWGSAEAKEIAIHLKAMVDLLLVPEWIPPEHLFIRSAIFGALYIVAAYGEHDPYVTIHLL